MTESSCHQNTMSREPMALTNASSDYIIGIVNAAYSARAREDAKNVAEAFGYTEDQLSSVPEGAHMGLSCGNPVVTATIKEGETVVDMGSGGGIDVFLAAGKVGLSGRVIGLDMSQEMIDLARKNASKRGLKPTHVAFVKAVLTEALPIASNSVDCILSNCVINLLPFAGKSKLLKEIYRILKPGGRVVLDDIVAKKPLPDNIKNNLASYVACIAGAILVDEYKTILQEAGLTNILLVDTKNDLSIYYQGLEDGDNPNRTTSCCAPAPADFRLRKPDYDVNDWVASYQIFALKNGTPTEIQSTALLRWWDAYPTVNLSCPSVTTEEMATLMRDPDSVSAFAVIDVRKNDHAGGHVRGSHNWFAQTFYNDLPAFYEKFKSVPKVIFYCQSSNGRGPRCAGWYQNYLDLHDGQKSTAFILEGGIKNWLSTFEGQEDLIAYE